MARKRVVRRGNRITRARLLPSIRYPNLRRPRGS
jgi:hypothetical protein